MPPTTGQRGALRALLADPSAPSPAKVATYLSGRPLGFTDEPGWMADHSALLGVPLARFGEAPGYDLSVLDSTAPVTYTGLE